MGHRHQGWSTRTGNQRQFWLKYYCLLLLTLPSLLYIINCVLSVSNEEYDDDDDDDDGQQIDITHIPYQQTGIKVVVVRRLKMANCENSCHINCSICKPRIH